MAEGKWVLVESRKNRKIRKVKWEDLISVFMSNLPKNMVVDWLQASFSQFGKIFYASIPSSSRRGKGFCFGFVRFGDRNSANRAVECMNGKFFWRKKAVREGGYFWVVAEIWV